MINEISCKSPETLSYNQNEQLVYVITQLKNQLISIEQSHQQELASIQRTYQSKISAMCERESQKDFELSVAKKEVLIVLDSLSLNKINKDDQLSA